MDNQNTQMRQMYHDIVDIINKYTIPYEAKRIILEDMAYKCEKIADESIRTELGGQNIDVGDIVLGGIENAENIQ